jgi:hypothetical protein
MESIAFGLVAQFLDSTEYADVAKTLRKKTGIKVCIGARVSLAAALLGSHYTHVLASDVTVVCPWTVFFLRANQQT